MGVHQHRSITTIPKEKNRESSEGNLGIAILETYWKLNWSRSWSSCIYWDLRWSAGAWCWPNRCWPQRQLVVTRCWDPTSARWEMETDSHKPHHHSPFTNDHPLPPFTTTVHLHHSQFSNHRHHNQTPQGAKRRSLYYHFAESFAPPPPLLLSTTTIRQSPITNHQSLATIHHWPAWTGWGGWGVKEVLSLTVSMNPLHHHHQYCHPPQFTNHQSPIYQLPITNHCSTGWSGSGVNEVLSLSVSMDPSHNCHQPLINIPQVDVYCDDDAGEADIAKERF